MNKKVFVLDSRIKIVELIGKLTTVNPENGMQPIFQVTVQEYKQTRSKAQNALYWVWLKACADHIYAASGKLYSDDDLHEFFKDKFLPTKIIEVGGDITKARKSTKKLNTKEFTEYLEQIDIYAAEVLHLVLEHPEDLYFKAMGIK